LKLTCFRFSGPKIAGKFQWGVLHQGSSVTRLDRLARSTRDLLNIVHAIAERGAACAHRVIATGNSD
jgi:hypothetical protein